jgi:hypothetical protein
VTVHVLHYAPSERPEQCAGSTTAAPDGELAHLAHETGGTYSFAPAPFRLDSYFEALVPILPGRFLLPVEITGISGLPPGRYKLSVEMTVEALVARLRTRFVVGPYRGAGRTDTRLAVFAD